jgi:rhomboid family GlyGly-CTERM serine protease
VSGGPPQASQTAAAAADSKSRASSSAWRWPASAWTWAALAVTLGLGSLVVFGLERWGVASDWRPSLALDWQPSLSGSQPWRAWSAGLVHFSELHLAANLAGCVLVAALGLTARVPTRCVVAWALAWPALHLGLWVQPALTHYGGLSGVLHAGVAVVAVHLLLRPSRAQRRIGALVLAGLAIKLVSEAPWAGAISRPDGWDVTVAPLAHVSGALAGSVIAGLAEALHSGWSCVREALGAIDAHD